MSIEFPLLQKNTSFGPVSDPKIPIEVKTLGGYRTYRFLIDTGADFSLAPRGLARQIVVDWDACPETRVMGVEQGGVRARLGSMPVRIQNIELTIRCLFLDTQGAMFILGRADFLDRFALTIDHSQRRIILDETP